MANPRGNPQNLIPWQKGQSGNPSGRPRNLYREALLDIANERCATGESPLVDANAPKAWGDPPFTAIQRAALSDFTAWLAGDDKARNAILDRLYGKPVAAQEDREALAEAGSGTTMVFLPDKPSREEWDAQVRMYLEGQKERKRLEAVTVEAEAADADRSNPAKGGGS